MSGAYPTPPSRRASYVPVSHSSPGSNAAGLPHSPTDPYANLSSQQLSPNAYLSPENPETSQLLGRDSMHMPAPSLLSRDSTMMSLPGTPSLNDNRSSWGSAAALGGAAGAAAYVSSFLLAHPTDIAYESDCARSFRSWRHTHVWIPIISLE